MPRSIAPRRTVRPPSLRASAGLATALLLASTTAACTDDKKADDPTGPDASPVSVPLEVSVTRVAGTLGAAARGNLEELVTAPLQEYVDNALLGDYPRTDFVDAYSSFTSGAAAQAERDAALLTGAGFAEAESVTAQQLTARLSVLAPDGKVAGATARIRFVLDVDGQPVTLAGRLVLTREKGEWRIFGYDVHRNDLAGGGA
jgi:hypothetical protein